MYPLIPRIAKKFLTQRLAEGVMPLGSDRKPYFGIVQGSEGADALGQADGRAAIRETGLRCRQKHESEGMAFLRSSASHQRHGCVVRLLTVSSDARVFRPRPGGRARGVQHSPAPALRAPGCQSPPFALRGCVQGVRAACRPRRRVIPCPRLARASPRTVLDFQLVFPCQAN